MTTLSIALATYNGEQYLPEQLRSLAQQTRRPDELVVSDDGSKDATLEILRAFAMTAPFPVHIKTDGNRLGYERNFLRCAEACNGDYISFCDQDDIWLPHKLDRVLDRIGTSRPDLIFHNATVFSQDYTIGPLYSNYPQSLSLDRVDFFMFAPLGFTSTFNRRLLRFNHLHSISRNPYIFRNVAAHDQWVHFLATLHGTIDYVPEQLALYRQHNGNVVGAPKKRNQHISMLNNVRASSQRQIALWECARRRLDIIERIESMPDSSLDRLQDLSGLYRDAVRVLKPRKDLYTARKCTARLQALIKLVKLGAYGSRASHKALGKRGFAKDLLVGLPLGPILRWQK